MYLLSQPEWISFFFSSNNYCSYTNYISIFSIFEHIVLHQLRYCLLENCMNVFHERKCFRWSSIAISRGCRKEWAKILHERVSLLKAYTYIGAQVCYTQNLPAHKIIESHGTCPLLVCKRTFFLETTASVIDMKDSFVVTTFTPPNDLTTNGLTEHHHEKMKAKYEKVGRMPIFVKIVHLLGHIPSSLAATELYLPGWLIYTKPKTRRVGQKFPFLLCHLI